MTTDTSMRAQRGYVPVNGLEMYYEIHGEGGVPLLLLHGSMGSLGMFRLTTVDLMSAHSLRRGACSCPGDEQSRSGSA